MASNELQKYLNHLHDISMQLDTFLFDWVRIKLFKLDKIHCTPKEIKTEIKQLTKRYSLVRKKIAEFKDKPESIVPEDTPYYYDKNGTCPYWHIDPRYPKQENGVCLLTGDVDWGLPGGFAIIWDQVKICGLKEDYE